MSVEPYTINGKCSNCGECCSPAPMPLKLEEFKTIKEYIKKNKIKQTNTIIKGQNEYLQCCFRDVENKKCKIYEVRPEICKKFKCDNTENKINLDKKETHIEAYFNEIDKKGNVLNLTNFDYLFYTDLEPLFKYLYASTRKNFKSDDDCFKNVERLLNKYGYKGELND